MKIVSGQIRLAATDVSNHLACHYLTNLELSAERGERTKPDWEAPDLVVIRELGLRHEADFLKHLAKSGLQVLNLEGPDEPRAVRETLQAMENGADVIAQGALSCGKWFGRPDVLQKVGKPSRFGNWSYEAYDCKLSRETKATAVLQLGLYSELLGEIQGAAPESMWVVPPSKDFRGEPYRVAEYAAYYRYVKKQLEGACENGAPPQTYPEPCLHCDVCRWFRECDKRRRDDDHLSLVAGIRRLQRNQLEAWSRETVVKLAEMPIPLPEKPLHGSREAMVRVREQARVQVEGRTKKILLHELLDVEPDVGFCRLPEPSPGDIFVDLEGDPFAGDIETGGGHQYLFGFVKRDTDGDLKYEKRWALDAAEEHQAFEWLVDQIAAQQATHPAMHVYHFGAYEPSKLRYLMGRYATCQEEIDGMLRAGVFVDLHSVLKEAVRASVEEYSLKKIEAFYSFQRQILLDQSRRAMRYIEHHLQLGWDEQLLDEHRDAMEGYNADDCRSTAALRDWLEEERFKKISYGAEIPRPVAKDSEASDNLKEWQQRAAVLTQELISGIPDDPEQRNTEEQARWLMAQLVDWHWRDAKPASWEHHNLAAMSDELLLDERKALSGLTFVGVAPNSGSTLVHRYSYPRQETDLRSGKEMWDRKQNIGTLLDIDLKARTVDIEKSNASADVHPASIIARDIYRNQKAQQESLYRIGCWIRDHGVDAPGAYRAGRDLLLRKKPRLLTNPEDLRVSPVEEFADEACRIVRILDSTSLPIQGPPGVGKTTTCAQIINDLVPPGKKIGVSATSHEVIHKLLLKVREQLGGERIRCLHKCERGSYGGDEIATAHDNKAPLKKLKSGLVDVVGATAFMWSREEFANSVDVLIFDEAGQMSLADILCASHAAPSIVLVGDPQQLKRPQKGSHPEGADLSALEHLLVEPDSREKLKILPAEKGLFIEKTKRLHPKVCDFTSEIFYESKLHPISFTANQVLKGHPLFSEPGLYFVPVGHAGNQNSSPEEVEVVARITESLLKPEVLWHSRLGTTANLRREKDILIIAPYNAQVSDLRDRLPDLKIGTVDKFQGQDAPVVIYSLTTSSPEDAPHGMEFLYSLNRFNVATSRAMTAVIVVGSPKLFEPECKSPRQMQLANAFCAYLEKATTIDASLI